MNVWNKFIEKKCYVRTNKDRTFSGIIKEVVEMSTNVYFISLVKPDGKWVTIISSEVTEIKEEN